MNVFVGGIFSLEGLMRSYSYSDSDLLPCRDPLPATVLRNFPSLPSKESHQYEAALSAAGFLLSQGSYVSRMGYLTVYARNHAKLAERQMADNDFDFLCVLSIGGSYIRIWVTDFPNLFQFFRDIGAKMEERVDDEVSALRANASKLLGELLTGDFTLNVSTSR